MTIPSATLTDEEIELRAIRCDDFARYRELWANEIKSWHRNSEFHGLAEMAIMTLRNDAIYSPWYGSAHHAIHAAVDVLAAEIKRLRNASGIEAPSGGETVQLGSTEGESPTAAGGDARTPSGVNRHG